MSNPISNGSFSEALYARAEQYFSSQRFGRYATVTGLAKGLFFLLLYFLTYIFFLWYCSSFSQMLWVAVMLGFCHVLIPVNIAHDAIHNSLSAKSWINSFGRAALQLTGANAYMYAKKHLEAHLNKENGSKTTSIESQGLLMRRKEHSVNLHYIFYLFYAQYMIFIRDFVLFYITPEKIPRKTYINLYVSKGMYIGAYLILPFLVKDFAWWQVLLALMLLYFTVTVLLVIILLMPTQRMETSRITDQRVVNDRWVIEILEHNVDFSPKSKLLNHLAGGANLNVVHYLFPSVHHVHYNVLASLIEQTTKEFGVLYRKQNVKDVLGIHFTYLKNIHKPNVASSAHSHR